MPAAKHTARAAAPASHSNGIPISAPALSEPPLEQGPVDQQLRAGIETLLELVKEARTRIRPLCRVAIDTFDHGAVLTPDMVENFRDAFQLIDWTMMETLDCVSYEAEKALDAEGGAA